MLSGGNKSTIFLKIVINLFKPFRFIDNREKTILADGGYKGQKLIDDARTKLGAEFKVVLRPDESSKKFAVLPLRWIVERSFSWLENFRRIAMDYEFYSETGVAMVQLAFYRLMYNKIYD